MDKQKKQLIILVVLVVVAGVIAIFVISDDKKDNTPPSGAEGQDVANNPPGPAADQAGVRAPGAQPVSKPSDKKLEMPNFTKTKTEVIKWKWSKPIGEYNVVEEPSSNWPADPLRVLNIDVVDPKRNSERTAVEEAWKLDGVTRAKQWVDVPVETVDDSGQRRTVTERKKLYLWEVTFKGKRKTFKKGDRLTNTRYVISKIFYSSKEGVGAGIVLEGDSGDSFTIKIANNSRHEEEDE